MKEVASKDKRIHRRILMRMMRERDSDDQENTYYGVNPTCRDDHCVTCLELNLVNFIAHVAQPRVILQLCAGPLLVCC